MLLGKDGKVHTGVPGIVRVCGVVNDGVDGEEAEGQEKTVDGVDLHRCHCDG